ncbi:ubiquinone biosynthesis protein COQ4 [Henriciella litoralis]|uniref:ubiquinone biosynthesis protein COQ4 n=1 Tax=Henriciella litoralis TaxID=568102 RepID=UPI001F277261|nr:ubiquinone biosynthesis protein COQ4 [Henriciella litoralis]
MMSTPNLYIHPNRETPKFRPLTAWRHMQKLIADKEDTDQVFQIIEALNGKAALRDLERFASTERGQAELIKRTFLPPILDDHAPLHALPRGSVGKTYVEFMEREGLTAQGLVEESLKRDSEWRNIDDDLLWYVNRLRDVHDMFHILSGYGRDALGEAALLGFTHSQHGGRGVSFIAFMGGREIAKTAPPEARIKDVIREGRRHGKAAGRIVELDIESILPRQLSDVRAELGIQPPVLYQRALAILQEHGLEPETLMAA